MGGIISRTDEDNHVEQTTRMGKKTTTNARQTRQPPV